MTPATTEFALRPFEDADYENLAVLLSISFPEYPLTADEMRTHDKMRDPKCKWGAWVAEASGQLVGTVEWSQNSFAYHPQKFRLNLMVHPDWRAKGIGTALYDQTMQDLEPFDPVAIKASVREDWPASVAFAAKRGFVEEMRHWESNLDVSAFDGSQFDAAGAKAQENGIAVWTHAELSERPDHLRRLYELTETVARDVPSTDAPTGLEYEQWLKYMEMPGFLPDATFVALDSGGNYVGFSNLFASEADPDHLQTGLTGVRRENRRQGIALALKLRAVEFAQARGAKKIRTSNESNNRGMLSINEALGFAKQPAWINLVYRIKNAESA